MLLYLDHALENALARCTAEERSLTMADLQAAIMSGAVDRVRPKMMTVTAITAGLLPILWSTGTGSEVMSRIAVPMIGGMISSALLTLIVIPVIFLLVKRSLTTSQVEPGSAEDMERSKSAFSTPGG